MKRVSIIVPEGNIILSSITGSFKIFNIANTYLKENRNVRENFYEIQLVGIKKKTQYYDGLFEINPTHTMNDVHKTDLIIIPAFNGVFTDEVEKNTGFIPWIKEQYLKNGAEVASLCTGAFLLAETGLLKGKRCSTHWIAADQFKMLYPDIIFTPEKIITEDNGIYTSGGAFSFLNVMLYLVEKYSGRDTAIWCAKLLEIDYNRNNQFQFAIFNGQKEHNDEQIKDAQLYIENNFNEKISVEKLAEERAISRRNFIRRFKKATANTPLEYIQRVKIEAAKKRLETSMDNINEVMYLVGYNDVKAFRNIFKKYTGMTPTDYKVKYSRMYAL